MSKHPLFDALGDAYPRSLEQQFERVLIRIEELWDSPALDDYFSDLLIDKRGGRQGFPKEVMADIVRLVEYRKVFTLKQAELKRDALRELKRRGFDAGKASLLHAVALGDKELFDLLLRAGCNIHVTDDDGVPLLIIALKRGYTIVAQMLINAGADVNAADTNGFTPLLLACGKQVRGYKTIAELLIAKGAYVNVRDKLGYTPLLLALSGGTADIAEQLLERGADVTACGPRGETALSLARAACNSRLASMLELKAETRNDEQGR